MKRYKKEEAGKLEVGQILYTKHFSLTLDRNLCKGCELCKLICPREAISLVPTDSTEGKASVHLVHVNENKCDFHGICAVICPFSAIKITMNGENRLPAVEKEVFPILTRDIDVCSEKCAPGCKKCEETCPLGIISVKEDKSGTVVEIQKDLCASCQICWVECPTDAISVTKFYEGSVNICSEACPEGCKNCIDACPVNALALDEESRVFAKNINCIYCGACLQVCPESDALSVERTAVRHTPVDSGAWHKGLSKITSADGLARELTGGRTSRVRKAVKNLNSGELDTTEEG